MNARAISAIVRKDLMVVSRNKGVTLPIVIFTVFVFGILPWGVALIPSLMGRLGAADLLSKAQWLVDVMPARLQQDFAGYDQYQMMVAYVLVYMLAPLFLMIPLIASSVIAADSFAGEKERKTMEALLYTPTTDRELFVAKLLSGWLAAIAVALTGFVLYVVTANAVTWSQMHRILLPNATWLVLIFWLVPALPGLALGVMVLASARAQGFQDANQIGGVIVLPVLLLLGGQLVGVMYLSVTLVILLGLVIWLLDGLLIWLGSRSFRRGRLLGA